MAKHGWAMIAMFNDKKVKIAISNLTDFINAGPNDYVAAYDTDDNLLSFQKHQLTDYDIETF